MNIFYLHPDPKTCAEYHVDKHCVKMILETAQLLSTAHRVLDGVEAKIYDPTKNKEVKRHWLSDNRETILYNATHINHPSAVWARQNRENYYWLWTLLKALCTEYTYRYGKVHKCESSGLVESLKWFPNNLPHGEFTQPTPAMPDQYKVPGNSVKSYHNYYNGEKQRMFSWKQRSVPDFINKLTGDNYAAV
jgi:hypothetical protein